MITSKSIIRVRGLKSETKVTRPDPVVGGEASVGG